MSERTIEQDKKEIRKALNEISKAWREGDFDTLEKHFDEDMVIARPDFSSAEGGQKLSIDSYREFINRAMIRKYEESNHQIYLWGDTAVAHYHFEMEYALGGDDVFDKGHDLLVFARRDDHWVAVWRTMIPLPQEVKMQ